MLSFRSGKMSEGKSEISLISVQAWRGQPELVMWTEVFCSLMGPFVTHTLRALKRLPQPIHCMGHL